MHKIYVLKVRPNAMSLHREGKLVFLAEGDATKDGRDELVTIADYLLERGEEIVMVIESPRKSVFPGTRGPEPLLVMTRPFGRLDYREIAARLGVRLSIELPSESTD